MSNFIIEIIERKYATASEAQQEIMSKDMNDKAINDKAFAFNIHANEDANIEDYVFFSAKISNGDQVWYTDECYLQRACLMENIEYQLQRIERGQEPTFFEQVEVRLKAVQ